MPVLSERAGLGGRVEKLRLRASAVKNPAGFPGGRRRVSGGGQSEPFHRFLLPIPYPPAGTAGGERSSDGSTRGRVICEDKKRSLDEPAGRSDWPGQFSLRTKHLRRGGRQSEAKPVEPKDIGGRKRNSLGAGCVYNKRSALLSSPATTGGRRNPPGADFRRFGGWAAGNEPMTMYRMSLFFLWMMNRINFLA